VSTDWDAILVNSNSGLVLDLQQAQFADGTPTIQFNLHGGENQRWRVISGPGSAPGQAQFFYIAPDIGPPLSPPAKCLDIAGASTQDGATVQLFGFHGGENQQFRFEAVDDPENLSIKSEAFVHIFARHSNKCFDVEFQSQSQGAKVHQFHNNGQANQIWRVVSRNHLCS
jgi:Ricin-type beta-trefoil lectin domain